MLLTFSWICTEDFLLGCVRVCGCPRVRLRHRLTHQTRQANTTQLLHCKSGLCVCLCTALSLSFLLLLGVKHSTVEALPPSSPPYKGRAESPEKLFVRNSTTLSTVRDETLCLCVCVFVGSHGRPGLEGDGRQECPLQRRQSQFAQWPHQNVTGLLSAASLCLKETSDVTRVSWHESGWPAAHQWNETLSIEIPQPTSNRTELGQLWDLEEAHRQRGSYLGHRFGKYGGGMWQLTRSPECP